MPLELVCVLRHRHRHPSCTRPAPPHLPASSAPQALARCRTPSITTPGVPGWPRFGNPACGPQWRRGSLPSNTADCQCPAPSAQHAPSTRLTGHHCPRPLRLMCCSARLPPPGGACWHHVPPQVQWSRCWCSCARQRCLLPETWYVEKTLRGAARWDGVGMRAHRAAERLVSC